MSRLSLLVLSLLLSACASLPVPDALQSIVNQEPRLAPINLEKPAEIEFMSPENGAIDVSGKTALTFLWKTPVLALQNHQGARDFLAENLQLTPNHPGEWRSLGASGIMFQPETDWPASTAFTLRPTARLLKDFEYRFETNRLELENFEAQLAIGNSPVILNFNQAVDLKAIAKNLTVKSTNQAQAPIKIDVAYGKSTSKEEGPITLKHQLLLTPQSVWPEDKAFILEIQPGRYSLEGDLPNPESISFEFKTAGPLELESAKTPAFHDQSLVLEFSAPVSSKILVENLRMNPAPETPLSEGALSYLYENDFSNTTFYINAPEGAWDPETQYEISFAPDLKDNAGRSLNSAEPIEFQTNLSAFFNPIYFPPNYSVFENAVPLTPTFSYGGNVKQLTVSLNGQSHVFPLESSLKQRQVWELNLYEIFPRIFASDRSLLSGDYKLKLEVETGNQNQRMTYESRFFVSDFSVEIKEAANDRLTVTALPFPGKSPLPSTVDMEFFVGDWQTENRLTEISEVSPRYQIDIPDNQFRLVKVTAGNKIGYGSPYFNQGMSPWDAQANFGDWAYDQDFSVALFTDRPLYKPGQTLYYKGFIRALDLFGKQFPLQAGGENVDNLNYEITVYDPQYEILDTLTGQTEPGSFDGVYQLPDGAPLGNYRLAFSLTDKNNQAVSASAETPFWVQEYRKPNFLITTEFSNDRAIVEDTLKAQINAEYAFGGPLSSKPLEYTVTLFGTEPCRFWCWGPLPRKDKVITRGEGTLNDSGEFVVEIDLSDLELDDIDWNLLTLNATVKLSAAEQSSVETSIPFKVANRQFEFEPMPHFAEPNAALNLTGFVKDLDAQAVNGETVRLKVMQTKWVRNQRKNADGQFYGEWESVSEAVASFETQTGSDGQFQFNVAAPAKGGQYEFEFAVSDKERRELTQRKGFWVSGSDLDQVRQNNTNNILWLFPDQDAYEIGDRVEVFAPNTDFEPTRVHATIERGEVLESLIFDTENNTLSFEAEAWMTPNVFVSVLMEGRDEDGNLQVKWGAHPIKITDPERSLKVDITTDKPIYRPGETVNLNVVSTVQNEGVPADIAIAVVDQSLLALKSRVPLNLMETLIGEWPLGVTTYHTLANFVSVQEMETIMEEVQSIADRMELGFGGGGGKGDEAKPRGDFRDTATFIASVKTNEAGEGSARFTLPDNLTLWNIFAAGATLNNAFGTQTGEFRVTLPLLVSEIVPNFFRAEDQVRVGLLIYRDNSELASEPITVTLNLPPEMTVIGESQKSITVEQEARVYFKVKVDPLTEPKTVDIGFEIKGQTSGLNDSVVLQRTIEPLAQTLSVAEFQRVNESYELSVLPAASAFSSRLNLKVMASVATNLEPLLEMSQKLNYGCTEQRLAALAAQLYQRQFNETLGETRPSLDLTEVKETVSQIEKSFTGQGFAFWETQDRPNAWVTTQVLDKASLLSKFGAPIDPERLKSAAVWLKAQVITPCDNTKNWNCMAPVTRLQAAAVLVDYGSISVNDLNFLKDSVDSLEGRVWWLKAAQKMDTLSPILQATQSEYLNAIKQQYQREDRYGFWTETQPTFYSQGERLTALILETLMAYDEFTSEQETIARYLSESRKKQLSGNTAMQVLKTLTNYAEKTESQSFGAAFTLTDINTNQTLVEATLQNSTDIKSYQTSLSAEDPQSYQLTTTKPVFFEATLSDSLPAEALTANARGLWIERTVETFATQEPVENLTIGENYRVKLRVVTAKPHRQVLVEDLIPSGAEIVNFALENADQTLQEPTENCETGWCTPLVQHQEFRADKARFFIDYLPAGTYELTYILNARLSGEFEWLPARAEEMYFPEVFANTAGKNITIRTD